MKGRLQRCIDSVSDHSQHFKLSLTHHNVWNHPMFSGETIVWHEPILDWYWYRIEAEIDRRKQLEAVTKNEVIPIFNVEVTVEHLSTLVAIFQRGRAINSSTDVFFQQRKPLRRGRCMLGKFCRLQFRVAGIPPNSQSLDSARCLTQITKGTCLHYAASFESL